MLICPLCFNKECFTIVEGADSRVYRECNKCKIIFIETQFLPSAKDEKERYLTHNNGIQYKGYVDFLNQAIEPALPLLRKNMQGLDFGCGPTPTLSVMLEKKGYNCDNYDPLFFPEMPIKAYDFIFATECFEHFFFPAKEIQRIIRLLKPDGFLIVMTEVWKSAESFCTWYYTKDPTHVTFYHNQSFEYIAKKYHFKVINTNNERVFIYQK